MKARIQTIPFAAMLVAAGAAAAASASAMALTPPEAKLLVPHRAVYDVELDEARSASGITGVSGRMVFEFTGSTCEGFTQNLRFVMSIINRDGVSTLSDIRSSTWEDAGGDRFRFSNNSYENERQTEQTIGNAERSLPDGKVSVQFDKPKADRLDLDQKVLFPVQHTVALLAAALKGERIMAADLYDGSDNGSKVFFTNTLIGATTPVAADAGVAAVKNFEQMSGMQSWPVTIAYYDGGSAKGLGTPNHEMSFRFYANGVINNLAIDYGSISITGKLAEIEFFDPSKCP